MSFATQLILRDNPYLVKERSKPGTGAKAWDKKLLGLGLLLTLTTLVTAGLDSGRYHWSPNLSWIWSIPGLVLNLTGMSIFLLTRISTQISTAEADPGMSTALRSVGLLDILSSMPAGGP
jgi:hypothetical protein